MAALVQGACASVDALLLVCFSLVNLHFTPLIAVYPPVSLVWLLPA
jgi:hypothetical protein